MKYKHRVLVDITEFMENEVNKKMHVTRRQTEDIIASVMGKIKKSDQVDIRIDSQDISEIQKDIHGILF